MPEFVQYLRLLYEDAKDRLVSCTDGDIPRVRGEAATYKKLIDALVRPSLKTKQ